MKKLQKEQIQQVATKDAEIRKLREELAKMTASILPTSNPQSAQQDQETGSTEVSQSDT